jgi:NADH-quinone oxidoreductase subunit L
LIGFWNYKNSANAAAIKAFIVNRVGDFGLRWVSLPFRCIRIGPVRYIFADPPERLDAVFNFLGLISCADVDLSAAVYRCVGKSAQLGLHTWLPDAMEGPTPVSALIHAATMVTAGVFLVARFSPCLNMRRIALMVVCVVGALTAIVAATIGLTQFDIKRVIAYSTMSQLGLYVLRPRRVGI